MKLSELVEAKAREAANSVYAEYADDLTISSDDWGPDYIEKHIQSAIIAVLNECGYALMLEAAISKEPLPDLFLDTAEAKLKELKEMSK